MNTVCPTPQVLKWARESSGYTVEEVVAKLKRKTITDQTLSDWESGNAFPSYPQLERLAYEIYKRPLAVFFFPEPPDDENDIQKSFRTLPQAVNNLNPRMRWMLRKAHVMQMNVIELHENKRFKNEVSQEKKIFNDIRFTAKSSISSLASKTRKYLKISLEEQQKWSRQSGSLQSGSDTALKKWREVIQSHGVFVFKDSFKDSNFSGFCLYDERFPVIYINNNESKNRQIFTLFHELAHILFQTSGFDPTDENYFRSQLTRSNQKIETICNEFAGAFLVPDESLPHQNNQIELKDIQKQANTYSVSQDVFLIRLLKNKIISKKVYSRFKQKIAERYQKTKNKKKPKGGNYYATKETYLGEKYISLVFKQYHQRRISLNQAAEFLGVNSNKAHQIDPFKQKGMFE